MGLNPQMNALLLEKLKDVKVNMTKINGDLQP